MEYFRFKKGDKIKLLPQAANRYLDYLEHKDDIGIIDSNYYGSNTSEFNYRVKWPHYERFGSSNVGHSNIIGANWGELPKIDENMAKYNKETVNEHI